MSLFDKNLFFFEKLGKIWWNYKNIFKSLHVLNVFRISYILRYCDLKNKNILDIGCGVGIFSESLYLLGSNVTSIDVSSVLIFYARSHSNSMGFNIKYLCISLNDFYHYVFRFQYDVIVCMELLEHVSNPLMFIKIFKVMLKKKGILFISTLNKTYKSYLFSIVIAEYFFNIIPYGTHRYFDFINPILLKKKLLSEDFFIYNIQGINYNPFDNEVYFTDNLSVNYFLIAINY